MSFFDEVNRVKEAPADSYARNILKDARIIELTRQNKILREALLSCDLNYKMDSDYLRAIIAISDSHSSSDKNLARISLIVREALKAGG